MIQTQESKFKNEVQDHDFLKAEHEENKIFEIMNEEKKEGMPNKSLEEEDEKTKNLNKKKDDKGNVDTDEVERTKTSEEVKVQDNKKNLDNLEIEESNSPKKKKTAITHGLKTVTNGKRRKNYQSKTSKNNNKLPCTDDDGA